MHADSCVLNTTLTLAKSEAPIIDLTRRTSSADEAPKTFAFRARRRGQVDTPARTQRSYLEALDCVGTCPIQRAEDRPTTIQRLIAHRIIRTFYAWLASC